ncbi:hypothetical protein HS041_20330 [Planomonospora sp. ID67723]|uniref:hypothetical protein n=1 Tax=Planomonospora sp. ID67723 TaxID=2738134 RepID=UPI0018C3CFD8|nr:hypothetical protein [Planomonospora sp. ID67723]MBG0830117.1 hypothetical protein [Planomonospora sp. ID67723]
MSREHGPLMALGFLGTLLCLERAVALRRRWGYAAPVLSALGALFLGFVMSMVFGHAPVILPAVLRVGLPYRPVLYAPLALLHAAVAVHVAGDLAAADAVRTAGGLLAEISLLVFVGCAAMLARRARWEGDPR